MNPKLILADEPTGNLDSKNGLEVMQLLTQLNQEGTTVVMVTHSERDVGYAQRIINLLDGQVVPEVSLWSITLSLITGSYRYSAPMLSAYLISRFRTINAQRCWTEFLIKFARNLKIIRKFANILKIIIIFAPS